MRELAVVISWLHHRLVDKGSAGNDSPYPVAALVEPSLQSSIFSSPL
jgi:hypothetical protein